MCSLWLYGMLKLDFIDTSHTYRSVHFSPDCTLLQLKPEIEIGRPHLRTNQAPPNQYPASNTTTISDAPHTHLFPFPSPSLTPAISCTTVLSNSKPIRTRTPNPATGHFCAYHISHFSPRVVGVFVAECGDVKPFTRNPNTLEMLSQPYFDRGSSGEGRS